MFIFSFAKQSLCFLFWSVYYSCGQRGLFHWHTAAATSVGCATGILITKYASAPIFGQFNRTKLDTYTWTKYFVDMLLVNLNGVYIIPINNYCKNSTYDVAPGSIAPCFWEIPTIIKSKTSSQRMWLNSCKYDINSSQIHVKRKPLHKYTKILNTTTHEETVYELFEQDNNLYSLYHNYLNWNLYSNTCTLHWWTRKCSKTYDKNFRENSFAWHLNTCTYGF